MKSYTRQARDTPWASLGRQTVLYRAGLSLLPVGHVPYEPHAPPSPGDPLPGISSSDPDFEKYLIEIVGTAIQVGDGKLATCAHVVDAVNDGAKQRYLLTRDWDGDTYTFIR